MGHFTILQVFRSGKQNFQKLNYPVKNKLNGNSKYDQRCKLLNF